MGLTLIRNPEQQKRVGAIGLGAGTIAAYGRPGDVYRFYEINPDVIDVARNEFFFLTESEASIELVPGDGRLTLEREADQQFDVLVLDAFSGSATPVHLLTREAFELYFRHVKEDGIIAVNILNNYLELELVIERVVSLLGKHAVMVRAPGDETNLVYPSQWVLISSRPEVFQQPPFLGRGEGIASRTDLQVWTDDYSNLFQILKFFGK